MYVKNNHDQKNVSRCSIKMKVLLYYGASRTIQRCTMLE